MPEVIGASYPVGVGHRRAGRVTCEGRRQWVALRNDGTRLDVFTSAPEAKSALLRDLYRRMSAEAATGGEPAT